MRKKRISANSILSVFSSMKTAVVLICILIVLSVIGSLIPQGRDPGFYMTKYGEAAGNLLISVHLNNFFRSWIFLFFSGLFFINLSTCTVLRLYRRIKRKAPLRVGPDIIHLSLLFIMVLGMFAIYTRQETHILVGVGESFRLPEGSEVTLTAFDVEYYEDGRPKDWISRLVLSGVKTEEHYVEVNKPLRHGAYRIFQSSFDLKPYAIIDLKGHDYELGRRDGIPVKNGALFLADIRGEEGEEEGVFFFIKEGKSDEYDEVILMAGETFEEIRIRELYTVKQSGLQVVYQPGNGLILTALILFCVGLAVTFYQKLGDGTQ